MGVTYTNNTGKPIAVFVSMSISANVFTTVCTIDGLPMRFIDGSGGQVLPITLVVPNGSSYACFSTNAYVANEKWYELR